MQYRRTPLAEDYSPSELLNGRQIRARIDTLVPSPAHMAQGRQAREATKSQAQEDLERVTSTALVHLVMPFTVALDKGRIRDGYQQW